MSLPDIRESDHSPQQPRADHLDRLLFIFRRLEIERLMHEAHILGKAAVEADGTVTLNTNITPDLFVPVNSRGQRLRVHEMAGFRMERSGPVSRYQVRHDTIMQVDDQGPQRLRRDFVIQADSAAPAGLLTRTDGSYAVTLEQLMDDARPTDGAPAPGHFQTALFDDVDIAVREAEMSVISGFQLAEISDLTKRSLAAVRDGLTRHP